MKKKIALLLSLVMIISAVLVPTTLFAASSNSVSRAASALPGGTLYWQSGSKFGGSNVTAGPTSSDSDDYGSRAALDATYNYTGSDLRIAFNNETVSRDGFGADGWFSMELTNAEFAYYSSPDLKVNVVTDVDGNKEGYTFLSNKYDGGASTTDTDDLTTYHTIVYDGANKNASLSLPEQDLAFELIINRSEPNKADVHYYIPENDTNGNPLNVDFTTGGILNIPLVLLTDADEDVLINIVDTTGGRVSKSTFTINSFSSGGTTTTVSDKVVGKDRIDVAKVTIKENRLGTLKPGWFKVTAPDGYEWSTRILAEDPTKTSDTRIKLSASAGLLSASQFYIDPTQVQTFWEREDNVNSDYYHKVIYFYLEPGSFTPSTGVTGSLYIENLKLVPKNDWYTEDLEVKVAGVSSISDDTLEGAGGKINEATSVLIPPHTKIISIGMSSATLVVGSHIDWSVKMSLGDTKPVSIYSGFRNIITYNNDKLITSSSTVIFEELAAKAWFAERATTFTLTDKDGKELPEAKISGVQIATNSAVTTKTTEMATLQLYNETNQGKIVNSNGSSVTITPHAFTLSNWSVDNTNNAKGKLYIRVNVSTEVGFEGDIYLSVQGASINTNTVEPVLIATAKPVVTLDTKVTNVHIGYQDYSVADVTIAETAAGALARDKKFKISMHGVGLINNEMGFESINTKNITITGNKFDVSYDNGFFNISRISESTPGTIKLSNLKVYINRGVPNGDYYFTVGNSYAYNPSSSENTGTVLDAGKYAICNNSDSKALYDRFTSWGIGAKYIYVSTPGDNQGVNNIVTITANSATVVVNGKEAQMEAPVVIVNSSMFVPLRFVCNALGVDDNNVFWNNDTQIASVRVNNTFIGFKLDSSKKYINNVEIGDMIEASTGLPIKAFGQNGRIYIPFRELGNSLNINVGWDASNPNQATYNAQ